MSRTNPKRPRHLAAVSNDDVCDGVPEAPPVEAHVPYELNFAAALAEVDGWGARTDEMPQYLAGRQWVTAIIKAHALASPKTMEEMGTAQFYATELVQPLMDIDDPELLRDFIAGACRQAEMLGWVEFHESLSR